MRAATGPRRDRSRDSEGNELGLIIGSNKSPIADVGAEGGYYGEEEKSQEEGQEVEINSRICVRG
jgi:hypothetical protein